MTIEPFSVAIPDAALADLRDRLRRTRWPEKETVDDWSQGVPLAYIRDVCTYWADNYDGRALEARLNTLPQFRTALTGAIGGESNDTADLGLGIHFIHVESPHPNAFPLLI